MEKHNNFNLIMISVTTNESADEREIRHLEASNVPAGGTPALGSAKINVLLMGILI